MSAGPEHLSLDHLITLLQDDDPLVRVHAGFVLGALGGWWLAQPRMLPIVSSFSGSSLIFAIDKSSPACKLLNSLRRARKTENGEPKTENRE